MSSVPPHAFYYPNLCACSTVRLSNGEVINVSNDAMAACHENRHFLDLDLYKKLFPGSVSDLVAPNPPCSKVEGTKVDGGSRVVGMMAAPLQVVLMGPLSQLKIEMVNVLVVEDFPVPLHLSAKDDLSGPRQWCRTGAFNMSRESTEMAAVSFPAQYRHHHYWQPGGPISIGMCTETEQWSKGLQKAKKEGMKPAKINERDARDALAEKHGWRALKQNKKHAGTESWINGKTGDRIDYYPKSDRCKTTLKKHPRDEGGDPRGNPFNKDLVRDNVGGNEGLEKIFEDIRTHTGQGRYWKEE